MIARSLSILLFIVFLPHTLHAANPEPVRIGVIASLTGPAAEQGTNWLRGAELAADELNATVRPVELIVEDDRTNPTQSAAGFQRLRRVSGVLGVIGGTWDFLFQGLVPLAQRDKVPLLTPTNPIGSLPSTQHALPAVFTNALTLQAEMSAIEQFLRVNEIRTIALLYPNLAWGTMHIEALMPVLRKQGIQVKSDVEFPFEGYLDAVRVAALRIRQAQVDAVYAPISAEGLDVLIQELERLRVRPIVIASQHVDAAYRLRRCDDCYQRVVGVYPKLLRAEFVSNFIRKFGEEPKVYAAAGYDALYFFEDYLRQKRAGRSPVVSYHGVTGHHQVPARTLQVAQTEAVVVGMRGGKLLPVERVPSAPAAMVPFQE